MEPQSKFMKMAIDLARQGMNAGAGGPFGCVIVRNGEVIAKGYNAVTSTNDPTAHAEVVAIREACKNLNSYQLAGCELYTSCEPCPMCLGAIYWARPDKIYFAAGREDAAAAGFDDHFIYDEINTPIAERKIPMLAIEKDVAVKLFEEWKNKEGKTTY